MFRSVCIQKADLFYLSVWEYSGYKSSAHARTHRQNKNAAIRERSLEKFPVHFQHTKIYSLMLTNRCCDSRAGKGGRFREMVLIGSLRRVVQRNKTHLFTIWILALKLPVRMRIPLLKYKTESTWRCITRIWNVMSAKVVSKFNNSSCAHGTRTLCSPGRVKKNASPQIVKISEDGRDCRMLPLFILMFRGRNWPINQQMAHWQETVFGMCGKFQQVRLCRLHSWLLSAGLEKVLNLHALIWLNWNSGLPSRLCSDYNLSM